VVAFTRFSIPLDQVKRFWWLDGGVGADLVGDLLASLLSTSSDALDKSLIFLPPTVKNTIQSKLYCECSNKTLRDVTLF